MAVLVGRCIPLIRSLVSIPAGFRRMNFGVFTLYTAIGSLIWNTALIGAGYVLRDNWEDVEPILDVVQYVVVALIAAAILLAALGAGVLTAGQSRPLVQRHLTRSRGLERPHRVVVLCQHSPP